MNEIMERRPGAPILAILIVLSCWFGVRMATWELPFVRPKPAIIATATATATATAPVKPVEAQLPVIPAGAPQDVWADRTTGTIAPIQRVQIEAAPRANIPPSRVPMQSPEVLASHQLLWMAAMSQMPVPGDVAQLMHVASGNARQPTGSAQKPLRNGGKGSRWSLDGWLFLRPDAPATANIGPGFAGYGGSQAGTVLRYRLRPDSKIRAVAYLRATKALAVGREREFALGLSARPIQSIPVSAQVEIRATRGAAGNEMRPAALLVTEIPEISLPSGLRGEAYAAAGYVGGKFATAFVDGQMKLNHAAACCDFGDLRVGAGVWGGAQKGAARLDVGPSATLQIKLGTTPARLSMDYRMRVAGDASPDSGAAITLSAGF